MSNLKYLLSSLLLLLLVSCSSTKENGGGGTETGDPGATAELKSGLIAGKTVLDKSSNITIEDVTLWLDDNSNQKSYSRENGDFLIENLSLGEHVIYAQWKKDDIILMGKSDTFQLGIVTSHQKPFIYLGQSIVLTEPASLIGMIANNDSSELKLKLKNSIFQTAVMSNGSFELINVPAGSYTLEISSGNKIVYSQEIEFMSGETLDLGLITLNP